MLEPPLYSNTHTRTLWGLVRQFYALRSFPHYSSPRRYHQVSPFQSREKTISELEQDLEESLEELSDGIEVLQILEKAYDRTLKVPVITAPDASRSQSPARSITNQPMDISGKPSSLKAEMVPLMSGSSTALLAVLDQVPTQITNSDPSQYPSISTTNLEAEGGYDAVIKIAHVGDCMGMLVRCEEIPWRSEEIWWDFNAPPPVQLGPSNLQYSPPSDLSQSLSHKLLRNLRRSDTRPCAHNATAQISSTSPLLLPLQSRIRRLPLSSPTPDSTQDNVVLVHDRARRGSEKGNRWRITVGG